MTQTSKWLIVGGIAIVGALFYLLMPILWPFFIATILAYLGDPLVKRLTQWKLPRNLAALGVFIFLLLVVLFLPLLLIPLLQQQLATFITKFPDILDWVQKTISPWLHYFTGVDGGIDLPTIKKAMSGQWQNAGNVLAKVGLVLSHSGIAMVGFLIKLLVMWMVTFYLLRDWDLVEDNLRSLLPQRIGRAVKQTFNECENVLSAFFRGQLLVMLILAILYSLGLWLIGLQVALLAGILAGLLSIVPYLGLILGILVAGIAAVVQYQDWLHLVYVLIVFAVVHGFETAVLTPTLVGDKIGLHPVIVIFAILAGGQLFGFMGILLALPVAAVAKVLLKHAKHYIKIKGSNTLQGHK